MIFFLRYYTHLLHTQVLSAHLPKHASRLHYARLVAEQICIKNNNITTTTTTQKAQRQSISSSLQLSSLPFHCHCHCVWDAIVGGQLHESFTVIKGWHLIPAACVRTHSSLSLALSLFWHRTAEVFIKNAFLPFQFFCVLGGNSTSSTPRLMCVIVVRAFVFLLCFSLRFFVFKWNSGINFFWFFIHYRGITFTLSVLSDFCGVGWRFVPMGRPQAVSF